jgi:ribosomal protein S13
MRRIPTIRLLASAPARALICSALIIGVGLSTAAAILWANQRAATITAKKMEEITNSQITLLAELIDDYSDSLYTMRGLFAVTDTVDAQVWNRFVHTSTSSNETLG